MSTALTLSTNGIAVAEEPGHELVPVKTHSVLPRPPKACSEILAELPAGLAGRERLARIADALDVVNQDQKAAMRSHLEQLAQHMVHLGASDLDAGGPAANGWVWYRTNGRKTPCEELGQIDVDVMDVLILSLLSSEQASRLLETYAIDLSISIGGDWGGGSRRFRVSIYFDELNLAMSVRAIRRELRTLKSLDFHPIVARSLLFSNMRDGLTLITGVTGSGKSTTLDAIINANNQHVEGHIVVLGDPVEYIHASKKCIIRHREVGTGVSSFKAGVIQSLRQDPDMIVIGEMRDPDTITATLEVTDSGHRVFSTLHTRSAVESIDRIIAEYPSEEQERVRHRLGDVLRCVISQKLCPQIGGGLVLAKEVLCVTPSVQAAIKNGNLPEIYQMMWEGNKKGQVTLEQDLFLLMRRGKISPDTAIRYANNKQRLRQLMGK